MFDFATAWLLQNKVLLPGATTLVRLVSEIRERANQRLWKKLAALPDCWQTARVTELLDIPEGQRISPLEQLKKGPVTVSGSALTEALVRYTRLRNLEFSRLNFTGLPPIQLRNLARYAGMASVKYIARMPQQRKLAILTAFVKAQEITALDEAVDVLDMLILDITREAKKTGQKKRLRTLKDLDRAALLLARACSLLLDDNANDPDLRRVIFSCVPKNRLAESVSKVNELARPQDNNFHDEMVEQYGRVKRFLPAVLRDLHFRAASAGEHTLAAIHYLAELNRSKSAFSMMRLHISSPAPGNASYTMRRAGYNVPVIHCVCWNAFRMHYAAGISGWKTAIAGEIPARSYCRVKSGRHSVSPSAVRWDIPLTDIKVCNSWPFS